MLIDCDIHIGYKTIADLIPYLDAPTAELVRQSGTNGLAMPTYPWNHPAGWIRRDLYERGEGHDANFVYMSLDTLRARHLDPYGVDLGIVEPDEAAVFSVLPNAQLAAKLCSAYNDWLLENWLQPEPRLRGMIVVPAQWPEAAAREIRRVGGRDEFVGVFLPGASRIPYGNPVHDPIWEAANELGLPVAVHTHYETVGIAGPLTAAGMPDFYAEYHTLCGSGMYGHFVSILCHGIFERFPDTRVAMVEGGLVPFVGFLWRLDTNWKACRSEIPWCRRRPSEYVWDHVRFATQPLETPDEPAQLLRRSSPPARGDAHVRERLPPLGLRRARADAPAASRGVARQRPLAQRRRILPAARAGSHTRVSASPREGAYPLATPRPRAACGWSRSRPPHRPLARRGRLLRIADRCPHRGAPLCAGSVATAVDVRDGEVVLGTPNATVRCPWHKWEFDIPTGRALLDERLRVRRYDVRVHDDEIIVSLDHPAGH